MIIVFEGIDGSGKGTQSSKLSAYFTSKGIGNALFSFPNYTGTMFGGEVGKYLSGFYGDFKKLPAKFPAMLYAMDRFEMKKNIISNLDAGNIIIFDRYVPSNFAHQAVKLPAGEQPPFIDWVKKLEYNILEMPQADITIFLDAPPSVASRYVLKKNSRSYTSEKKDAHERDLGYLEQVYDFYKTIALHEGWLTVGCVSGDEMRREDLIFADVLEGIKERL